MKTELLNLESGPLEETPFPTLEQSKQMKTMVVTESQAMISQNEVESPLRPVQHPNRNHPFSSLGSQSSIYSLTLDEFQHTLWESGKNFGSMNMDEFLTSIWNAEENIATASSNNEQMTNSNHHNGGNLQLGGFNEVLLGDRAIAKQPSLPRQGSLSLPAPLCRKTVDEVWSEIQKKQQGQGHSNGNNNVQNAAESDSRQPTFGEITLEDFLIKAGIVREQCDVAPSHQQQYGLYQSNNDNTFVSRPVLGMAAAAAGGGAAAATTQAVGYQTMAQGAGGIGETSGRHGGFEQQQAAPPPGSVYGERVGNGGGYATNQAMGMVGQVSPVSSDAIGRRNSINNAVNQFGIDMGVLRGRKRIIDGQVEKVVERRQRRMIKNRESAARSRARKQAYTVELEAELNQLKEENNQLRHALAELERKRKQQYPEELRMKAHTKEKLRMMRRHLSCHL